MDKELQIKALRYLEEKGINKVALSDLLGIHRTSVSQYLNGNTDNLADKTVQAIEDALRKLFGMNTNSAGSMKRPSFLRTNDAAGVIAVCQSCQDYTGIGVIVGRSGYGKTYALKFYTKSPRVAYVECNESMNARDLVKAIERAVSLPHTAGTIDDRLDNIKDFFNANDGWLLIIDEADKLITKYTQKKAEILRSIHDQSDVGLVMAGEPGLDKIIRQYIPRMASRIDFRFALTGLSDGEVHEYIKGIHTDEKAEKEFIHRATNEKNGCFRLLNRTYNNVLRIAGSDVITLDTVKAASAMMLI